MREMMPIVCSVKSGTVVRAIRALRSFSNAACSSACSSPPPAVGDAPVGAVAVVVAAAAAWSLSGGAATAASLRVVQHGESMHASLAYL